MTARMTQDAGKPPSQTSGPTDKDRREARRKEALKANMARRKAQSRARGVLDQAQTKGTDAMSGSENE
jgi:hypothetical protein